MAIYEEFLIKPDPDFKRPDNIEQLKEELIKALEEEIKKIEKEGLGSYRYQITNGKLIKQEEDNYIYRFITDDIIELPDDLPIEVKIADNKVKGCIVTIVGFEVTIALNRDLGQFIPSAILLCSAKYLVEKIKSVLQDINEVNSKFNYEIVEKLFGFKTPSINKDIGTFQSCNFSINAEQKEAILRSLKNEILFIWGPPGTGKTTTLGGIIDSYLNRNKVNKILVLSHTNIATDKAAKEVIKKIRKEFLLDGKIIRFGNIVEEDKNRVLSDEEISFIKISKIAERKSAQFLKEKKEQETKLKKLVSEKKEIEDLFFLRSQTFSKVKELDKLTSVLDKRKIEEKSQRSKLQESQDRLKIIEEKIKKAESSTKFMRFISGLNINQLILEKVDLNKNIENFQEKINILFQEITSSKKDLDICKEEYFESYNTLNFIHVSKDSHNKSTLINEFDQEGKLIVTCFNCERKLRIKNEKLIFSCPRCEYKFEFFPVKGKRSLDWTKLESTKKKNLSRIKEIQKIIIELNERINEINDNIIREAQVIITTTTQIYLSRLISSMSFREIIIDEGSMILLPVLFFASGLASDKVVIVGDFKQLSPISMSGNKYLTTDIFEFSGIKKNAENNISDDRLVSLKEQFRMHPSISEICNLYVYSPQNELIDSNKVKDLDFHKLLEKKPYSGEPIVFCDTSRANPWCNSSRSGSAFNLYHSIFVMKIIEGALKNGVSEKKIGIITPFRDQAKFINRMRQRDFPDKKIKISTVHKFQGLENEIIIFDTVISTGKKRGPGYFFDKSEQSNRLLNVAITRPKSKLIIVGNCAYLENRLNTNSLMYKILSHFKKKNKVFNSQNIIEEYYKEMIFNKKKFEKDIDQKIDSQYFKVVDQNDFYEIFEKDLLGVGKNEGVVIFSPFVQYARASSLMNVFKAVIDKGAKLTIFTEKRYKNPGLFSDPIREILDYLKGIGADINYKAQMHEKRAFISNRIWWDGSLNILSHSGTTEDMLRISQKEIVELAINNFGLGNLLGVGKAKKEERDKWRSIIKNALKNEEKNCPKCNGMLIIKFSRFGPFLACNNKECKITESIPLNILKKRIEEEEIKCPSPKCNKGYIQVKISKKGGKISIFFACDNYPDCKYILPI